MDSEIQFTEKVETRDVDTILTDENATVDELIYASGGESVGEQVETTTTGASFEDVFGVSTETVGISLGIAALISLIIAIVAFFTITMKKKALKGKFMNYLREFLNFRRVWVASILKFIYLFFATLLTIGSIVMMFFGGEHVAQMIIICLLVLVFGNVLLRVGFEMTMITIGLWENTNDMRAILVNDKEAPDEEETVEIEEDEEIEE